MTEQAKLVVQRQDAVARALARIVAVADAVDGERHPALAEALEKGREALATRDEEFRRRVLVVGGDTDESATWIARYSRPDGIECVPVFFPEELATYVPPFTVVALPGAVDRDDWPTLAAQIAVLGPKVDVIRTRAIRG